MINLILPNLNEILVLLMGVAFAFLTTFIFTFKLKDKLPRDGGRDFAVDGKLSAGKPRGAGIIFVLCFTSSALLFGTVNIEILGYLLLVLASMFTGYFDDAAEKPWGELKKGLLDLTIAILVAIDYLWFNPNRITLAIFDVSFEIPRILFGILIVILVWVSVNVTNCSDGVDGLSGTLTCITLGSVYILMQMLQTGLDVSNQILMFIAVLVAYLWFNATPSILLMGDAGSRAMGLFIAVMMLKSGSPIIYILLAIVLILDGGLGLIKVSLIRYFKLRVMIKLRTPIHDHVRKVLEWSNTQAVFRFAIIQIVVSAITLLLVKM